MEREHDGKDRICSVCYMLCLFGDLVGLVNARLSVFASGGDVERKLVYFDLWRMVFFFS